MKVVVHDRTAELPDQVRTYAEQRLLRIGRHFDRVVGAEVEFAREAGHGAGTLFGVQIIVHLDGRRHPLAKVVEAGGDPRTALDLALDKMDRQVVKLKEKIRVERKRPAGAEPDREPELDPGPERVRLKLAPQTLAEAEAALDDSDQPCYVFLEEDSGAIGVCFRRPDGRLVVLEPVVV